MGDINLYKPEFNLERDTFLGTKEVKTKKLFYLSKMAQDEQWNYSGENENKILYNYLFVLFHPPLELPRYHSMFLGPSPNMP